jgi:hypothetical protein
LIDVARALLSEDDRAAERVAAQLARDRQLAERKAADRAEADAAKRRQASVAKWIADECRRQGFWWPSDYT